MTKDFYELTTEDLILDEPAQTRKFVPSAISRPIKERSRTQSQAKPPEGNTGMAAKAASFYEEALEAQRAGDAAAAVRHLKMAITFNPNEPRYQELLSKLGR